MHHKTSWSFPPCSMLTTLRNNSPYKLLRQHCPACFLCKPHYNSPSNSVLLSNLPGSHWTCTLTPSINSNLFKFNVISKLDNNFFYKCKLLIEMTKYKALWSTTWDLSLPWTTTNPEVFNLLGVVDLLWIWWQLMTLTQKMHVRTTFYNSFGELGRPRITLL